MIVGGTLFAIIFGAGLSLPSRWLRRLRLPYRGMTAGYSLLVSELLVYFDLLNV